MVNAGFVAPPPASPAPPPSPPPNVLLMLDLENYEKGSITFQVHLPYISPISPPYLPNRKVYPIWPALSDLWFETGTART